MIYGIGTDVLLVSRIAQALERHGDRFAQRILGDAEMAIFKRRRAKLPARGVLFLATRFAAKEAFSKAIGMGMRSPMRWRAVEFVSAPSGKPMVVTHGLLQAWMNERQLKAHVSLSDEGHTVLAFVVVEVNHERE